MQGRLGVVALGVRDGVGAGEGDAFKDAHFELVCMI